MGKVSTFSTPPLGRGKGRRLLMSFPNEITSVDFETFVNSALRPLVSLSDEFGSIQSVQFLMRFQFIQVEGKKLIFF